jgi:hypothetical protein
MKTNPNQPISLTQIGNVVCHPLGILGVSLGAGAIFALFVMLRTDGFVRSWLIYYFLPVGVVFVSFILDRVKELRKTSILGLFLDLLIVLLSLARAVTSIPFYSGHALFLTYTLLSARLRVVKILSLVVLLQVMYLKLIKWDDWVTLLSGLVVGILAGTLRMTKINQKFAK